MYFILKMIPFGLSSPSQIFSTELLQYFEPIFVLSAWCIRVRENLGSQGVENLSGNVMESQGILVSGQGKFLSEDIKNIYCLFHTLAPL